MRIPRPPQNKTTFIRAPMSWPDHSCLCPFNSGATGVALILGYIVGAGNRSGPIILLVPSNRSGECGIRVPNWFPTESLACFRGIKREELRLVHRLGVFPYFITNCVPEPACTPHHAFDGQRRLGRRPEIP